MKYVFGFVGCGAGANFLIKQLINNKELFSKCLIHLYEKNPYPFGLIRDGIAPDHQKSKQLIKEFSDNIIKHKNQIEYFGNVNISNINKLKKYYSAIILSMGAQQDNKLNIPGEDLKYVYSSREISNWYNCSIHSKKIEINNKSSNLVIIGNGNVSIDIARILALRNIEDLSQYEISTQRLKEIQYVKKYIKKVFIIARRGIEFSAFTTKQIRQFCVLAKKNNWRINVDLNEFNCLNLNRDNKRKIEVLQKYGNQIPIDYYRLNNYPDKHIFFIYNSKPFKIDKYNTIYFNKKDNTSFSLPSGVLVKSIGVNTGTIKSINNGNGIYKVGWSNTNGKGTITQTLYDSMKVYEKIMRDIKQGRIQLKTASTRFNTINTLLKGQSKIMSFDDWLRIDKYEKEEGRKIGKSREKILKREQFLQLL